MLVYGGVYSEVVEDPRPTATVLGSGLRAAALLARDSPTLIAAIDTETKSIAESVAASVGLTDVVWHPRAGPIVYRYELSIGRPSSWRPGASADGVEVDGDQALVFGTVEGIPHVRVRDLIVDPQHSLSLDQIDSFGRERLVVIANQHELRRLGECDDVTAAAEVVRSRLSATAVVAKLGAVGTWLQAESESGYLPSVRTARTWPIGSGDAFSAGFARAWFAGADVRASTEAGRAVAAHWCSARSFPAPAPSGAAGNWVATIPDPPSIYLAGPFFDPGQRMLVRRVRDALGDVGASVFSPMHDVGFGGPEVAAADLAGLAGVAAVLALTDGTDAGTLFEIGWAVDRGIPVVAYAESPPPHAATMLRGTGVTMTDDLAAAVYQSVFDALGRPA